MATFKAIIKKEKMRSDKTWNVLIRLTHERKIRYISTTMYVTKKDITSGFKIKNQQIIDRCEELIKIYREKIYKLNLELNAIDIDLSLIHIFSVFPSVGTDIFYASRQSAAKP